MLPILIVMDIVALFAYKGRADWKSLSILLPAAMAGIAIGWATAAYVNDAFVTLLIGIISLLFVADYVFKRRKEQEAAKHNLPKGLFWGTITGFTSFIRPHRWPTVPDVHAAHCGWYQCSLLGQRSSSLRWSMP